MPGSALGALLTEHSAPEGHFDELLESPGRLRPHWAAFAERAAGIGAPELTAARARVDRQLHENGVTYNLHTEGTRAWALDVLPHIMPAAEWDQIAAGLRQRARLLEAVTADIYGRQRLLGSGLIPSSVVFGNPAFLRAAHGVRPPSGVHLHVVAFDLARGPDAQWRVLATRTQAPSGAGYALENRLTVSRLFPDAFRDQRVQLLAPFFRTLQETLLEQAPCRTGTPHIVLLTPGRYNETYFEHAYLSRYLGFTLVEGADLTVRDDSVCLKTVNGLRPVHAILRRMDDDFSDPLELRADSTLGVPGLLQAWRAGTVLVANAFGSGILESAALSARLPDICLELFGESLAIGAADSQCLFPLSHVPVWEHQRFESRGLSMRVFLATDGHGDYTVLPGGLSQISGSDDDAGAAVRDAGNKDTWVLSDLPVERFSLLPGRLRPSDIARSERAVSSRAGEHLFWLGRYAERSENAARLLRAVLSRLPQGDASVSETSPPLLAACRRLDLLPQDGDEVFTSAHEFERTLIGGLVDGSGASSLAYNVAQLVRVAGAVRDRLSGDNWRVLNQLSESLTRGTGEIGLAEAIERIDDAIILLVAIGGLEMAHMTRDEGWRFLSLGRHLERVLHMIATTSHVARSDAVEDPALLEWLLDLSDSIITYRARYMGRAEWLAVADLLLFDRRNPRSAAFQLGKLGKHVPLLPGGGLGDIAARLDELSAVRVDEPDTRELFPRPDTIGEFLAVSEQTALHLSDALTLRYFTHVYEPAHATLL
jgi:uncharacterized circularly permuted ATP-grasp superfamily protein/uncharacterized alpha-E superfamily protein